MAMNNATIVSAMISILGTTPTAEQHSQMTELANAIIATIQSATITYTTGLVDSATSAPIVGVLGCTIS
jgi:hypothetical protein